MNGRACFKWEEEIFTAHHVKKIMVSMQLQKKGTCCSILFFYAIWPQSRRQLACFLFDSALLWPIHTRSPLQKRRALIHVRHLLWCKPQVSSGCLLLFILSPTSFSTGKSLFHSQWSHKQVLEIAVLQHLLILVQMLSDRTVICNQNCPV